MVFAQSCTLVCRVSFFVSALPSPPLFSRQKREKNVKMWNCEMCERKSDDDDLRDWDFLVCEILCCFSVHQQQQTGERRREEKKKGASIKGEKKTNINDGIGRKSHLDLKWFSIRIRIDSMKSLDSYEKMKNESMGNNFFTVLFSPSFARCMSCRHIAEGAHRSLNCHHWLFERGQFFRALCSHIFIIEFTHTFFFLFHLLFFLQWCNFHVRSLIQWKFICTW